MRTDAPSTARMPNQAGSLNIIAPMVSIRIVVVGGNILTLGGYLPLIFNESGIPKFAIAF
jgi:hypothetical protein